MSSPVDIDPARIARARTLSDEITAEVHRFIEAHTTVSVERSVLRLYGVEGAHKAPGVEIPLVNVVVDLARKAGRLGAGIAPLLAAAMKEDGADPQSACQKIAAGKIELGKLPRLSEKETEAVLGSLSDAAVAALHRCREKKKEKLSRYGDPPKPYNYLIVATGNIFEDVV